MAPSTDFRRVPCARRGCRRTFQRQPGSGRPQKYCCVECRTKAATARRQTRLSTQPPLEAALTRELAQLREQIATIAAPPPAEPSRLKWASTCDSDLAVAVQAACDELRELTGALAADRNATRPLSQMNRVITDLAKRAGRSQHKNPG